MKSTVKVFAAVTAALLAWNVQAVLPISVGPTMSVGNSDGDIGLIGLWNSDTDWLFAGVIDGLEYPAGTLADATAIRLRDKNPGSNVVGPGIITLIDDPNTTGDSVIAYVNSVATRQLTQAKLLAGDYWIQVTGTPTGGFANMVEAQLTIVPEPHEYAMLAGAGLLGFAVYRRFRTA